uniref:LUC7-like (S. cerevisiae) n=1 Tax=Cyprinus carpio TaxID=7962 RepID=A0A8C1W9X5_CYPCA
MSAQAQMRALLDQLMGTSRDGDETRQRVKFTDERVCKSHLLNCCPHDILSGTRMDLGECSKIHDLALRADYEIASKERDLFFELDAVDHLESFIADCDRRTELAKKRLAETVYKALGAIMSSSFALVYLQEEYRNSMPASSFQQQKLRVCEVCSAYLGLHDNDRRLADHFGGKLHLGFIQIREKLEQLKKTVQDKQEKRNQERLKRREEREREERMKKQSRSRDRDRDRRRRRSRSASREKRRSRSRSKERDRRRRHRSRSRSRSRHSREHSHKSSRDRDRERDSKRSSSERRSDGLNGRTESRRHDDREAGEI